MSYTSTCSPLYLGLATLVAMSALAIGTPVAHAQTTDTFRPSRSLFVPTDYDRDAAERERARIEEQRGLRTLETRTLEVDSIEPIRRPIERLRDRDVQPEMLPARMEANTTQMRAEIREHRSEAVERAREQRARALERVQERRLEITRNVSERVYTGVTKMLDRLLAHTEKLSAILERVVERLDALADEGFDTSVAREAIADAENAIAATADEITRVQNTLEEALNSDEPRTHMEEIRAAVRSVLESLREAHRSVAHAISTIRTVRASNNNGMPDTNEMESGEESGSDGNE